MHTIDINHDPSKCNVRGVYVSSGCCHLICVSIWFWQPTSPKNQDFGTVESL